MSQLNSLSDDQLIDRWVSGNDLIFAEIYNRYWDRLLAVAYNRLDDLYDAEECVQDVFCKFWTLRDKFELQGKDLGVYLVQAIRNQVFTVLRRRYRQREKMSAIPMIEDVDFITPERQLIVRELKKKFDEAINALPPQCKLVYKMQREQGLAIHEIAEKLNVSENTVKSHLKKANRDIRNNTELLTTLLMIYIHLQNH